MNYVYAGDEPRHTGYLYYADIDVTFGGAGDYRKKQKSKVLKDISRLNEIILREDLQIFDTVQVAPKLISRVEYDDNEDEEALLLLFA